MPTTSRNGRPPPSRALNRAIRDYLAERAGASATLQFLLDRNRAFEGELPSARRIKTSLLFTDIAGSSAIFDQYGDQIGRHIIALHDRIVDPIVVARGGVPVKHTGDGVLASFASCGRAVKTAILIQKAVARHNQCFPLLAFRIRIGVNIGAVIRGASDLYGTSVNLAARLCEAAGTGGILTTGIVQARCADKGYAFRSRGKITFKGFLRKIPVFEVLWEAPPK